MTRILPFVALALLLGCSSADDFPGYSKQSGDLGTFILQHLSKFGARTQPTNALPKFAADWRYKEDADGFQVYIVGNHFTQLQSFLTAAFGPPATNELAGKALLGYYGPELGAALNYVLETTRDGKQYTSIYNTGKSA